MQFRRTHLTVSVGEHELTVTVLAEGYNDPIKVGVGDGS